jgi:RHS repeat-associated protein
MKNIILTLSAFLLIGASGAQILIDNEIPGNTTQIITAPEYIRMMPGFGYKPESQNYYRAYIDENASTTLPVSYQEYIDPEKRELDFKLPVGSTSGMASVSLTGAATYTIPIFSSPGTAGMQPSLSLVYSSQAGNGIAGYGWNISGLSAITRTGKTIYHEEIVEGIDFEDDRFALDGQRLIKKVSSQQYGDDGTQYFTEIFNGSSVISHGTVGQGPEWFEVIGKDGSIVEYGKTNNSRLTSQRPDQTTITWYINKITDPNGNYMLFIYDKRALEINIKEIKYTGNDVASPSIEPYNSIKFYYSDRTDNSTAFVSGSRIEQTLLLDHIDVVCEKNIVKHYKLKYFFDFYSKLNEVEEFGSDGTHFNSIVFGYGKSENPTTLKPTFVPSGSQTIYGDFDLDGLTDIFRTGYIGTSTDWGWEVYLNKGSDNIFNGISDYHGNLIKDRTYKFLPMDYNGDGLMDILIYTHRDKWWNGYDDFDIDLLHNTGSGFVSYHVFGSDDGVVYSYKNFTDQLRVLDVDGDNKDEFVFWRIGERSDDIDHDVYVFVIEMIGNEIVPTRIFYENYLYYHYQPQNIFSPDLNGDNKDELLIVREDKSAIYEFRKENNIYYSSLIYESGFPSKDHKIFIGDYNGDGRADLLTKVKDAQNQVSWSVNYWLEGSFIENEIIDILPTGIDDIDIADFNMESDVLAYLPLPGGNSTQLYTKIYYSFQNSFLPQTPFLIGYVSSWSWTTRGNFYQTTDFNGDGINDIGLTMFDNVNLILNTPWNNKNVMEVLANGFNTKAKFQYNTLADKKIYSTSGQLSYPLRHFAYPLKVVDTLSTDDGLGNYNSLSYKYANGILHSEGKGFLGFKEFCTNTSTFPIQSISRFEVHPTYYFMNPSESISKENDSENNVLISHSDFANEIKTGFEPANQVILPWQSLVTEKDFATGNKKTTEVTIDQYGNPLTQEVKIFDSHSATTETASNLTEYKDYWSASGNIPSKPQTIISRVKRKDQLPITITNKIEYNDNGNVSSTIDFFKWTKEVTTTYSDFTVVGLPKTTTISATDILSRVKRVELDNKYRFVTSQTDAEGYTSSTILEPAFGNNISITNANEQTITKEYDGFGTLKRQTDDLGVWEKIEFKWYTGATKPNVLYFIETTSNNGTTAAKYFDKLGRALYSANSDPNGMVTCIKTIYNNKGQVDSVSEPYFETATPTQFTTTTYHPDYGFPVSTTLPTGVIITSTTPTPENPGRIATVTNSGTGITTSREVDCTGKLIYATDPGGTLTYTYYSDGQIKQIDSPDGNTVSITYDEYGRQKTMSDPDAGLIEYDYDAFGQLLSQKDANGVKFFMDYDRLGRLIKKVEKEDENSPEITKQVFEYYSSTAAKGRRGAIDFAHYADENNNNTRETYLYNDKAQLTQKNIVTDNNNRSFTYLYTYDSKGMPDEYTYPTGFTIKNEYKADNGTLKKVIDKSTNTAIYEPGTYNARGQMMHFAMNNKSLYTTFGYDDFGLPTYRMTGNYYPTSSNIQNLETNFNAQTGNLNWRKDHKRNLTENFTYDAVHKNRLATWQVQGQQQYSTTYNNSNGNILTKTDFTSPGNPYTYGLDAGPHAVTGVVSPLMMPAEAEQEIRYNSFNKASYINHNYQRRELFLHYGPDEQRIKTEYKINGQTTLTRYFPGGGLEVEVDANGNERWLHYLPGGGLYVCDENFDKIGMYYVLTDYLGSWDKVISETGTPIEEYSFDPWGRRRNPTNWTYTGVPTSFTFNRGYTGHEMLDAFGLVNMNGRMYDPILGRMLSPDNYVSLPEHTQGYNRYTYALNNPLVITDPSGDNPVVGFLMMAAYSAVVNGFMSAENGDGFIQGFGKGAAIGAISYGVGAAIGPVMAGPGAIPGMVNAGVNTAISGGITYGFEALINNSSFNWSGWAKNVATSMAYGAVVGTVEAMNYNNLVGPRPFGEPTYINPIFGYQPSLDEKLNIILFKHSEGLDKAFGESGVSEVIAGSKKNLKGLSDIKAKGGLLSVKGDDGSWTLAKGAHRRGNNVIGYTTDKYKRFSNHKVYLSRYTIRNLYNGGNLSAIETLYHEFFHANDWYEGTADWLYNINGGDVTSALANSRMRAMLEFRAHSYNYSRQPTEYRMQMIEKYATRYWSLF